MSGGTFANISWTCVTCYSEIAAKVPFGAGLELVCLLMPHCVSTSLLTASQPAPLLEDLMQGQVVSGLRWLCVTALLL